MQQRVALARALVNRPSVLLLDEPLGALDRKLREDMQIELRQLHSTLGTTFIYVTHDQEEALSMSDRLVVMRDGEIEQLGEPARRLRLPGDASGSPASSARRTSSSGHGAIDSPAASSWRPTSPGSSPATRTASWRSARARSR